MPTLLTSLDWAPIFEWFVSKCGSKRLCSKEIGGHAQNFRLNSQHNGGGGEGDLFDHLMSSRELSL